MDRVSLLGRATVGSVLYRVSDANLALAHPWSRRILRFSDSGRDISQIYGGMEKNGDTTIIMQQGFAGTVIPPQQFDLNLQLGLGMAESGGRLFDGTAYLMSSNASQAKYQLYAPDYPATWAKGYTLPTTVLALFQAAATALGLTLDSSLARDPSPAISYSLTSETPVTDVCDKAALWCCHHGHIDSDAGKLYLMDMLADNGSRTVERRFFAPAMVQPTATSKVIAMVGSNNYSQSATFSQGRQVNVQPLHTSQSEIEARLADILTLLNQIQGQVGLPMADGLPKPGERITCIDSKYLDPATGKSAPVEMWIRARKFLPDFEKRIVTITGEGGMALQ